MWCGTGICTACILSFFLKWDYNTDKQTEQWTFIACLWKELLSADRHARAASCNPPFMAALLQSVSCSHGKSDPQHQPLQDCGHSCPRSGSFLLVIEKGNVVLFGYSLLAADKLISRGRLPLPLTNTLRLFLLSAEQTLQSLCVLYFELWY